ncbi:MAG TPA: hypothetical protein VGM84_17625 [Steroidobacteraceae bacterium]
MSARVTTSLWMGLAAATLTCAAGISRASIGEPNQEALSRAVKQFLTDHGDLCMAKYTWPRDVTPEDLETQTNDSLQLPVLEQLGLTRSKEIAIFAAPGAGSPASEGKPTPVIKRYWLTKKGQKYYVKKKRTTLGLHGDPEQHEGDFCIASLTLDKVVKSTPPDGPNLQAERIVSYTYRIKAADWMADTQARKVFPIVDRIIRGEGKLQMTATVQLLDGKWVPVLAAR